MNLNESLPRFLGNPVFGLLEASRASLVFRSIFLYYQSQQTRDRVFTAHPGLITRQSKYSVRETAQRFQDAIRSKG